MQTLFRETCCRRDLTAKVNVAYRARRYYKILSERVSVHDHGLYAVGYRLSALRIIT